jgi:hypothetical protein
MCCSLLGACIAPLRGQAPAAAPTSEAARRAPRACLSNAPIDLSITLSDPPPSFYVNELRLGYARGEAIFLSKPLCEIYGEALCRFVEAHEQAHYYMKTVGQQSSCAETLADCWAAVHTDAEAVEAVLEYFRGRQGGDGYHGEPRARADTIARCADVALKPNRSVALFDLVRRL